MLRAASDTAGNYEVARDAAEKGIAVIPVLPGTKMPAVKWKRWQSEIPPDELLRAWFLRETRYNIALVTTGMVLFDCDDPVKAELVLSECGDTPHQVKTPRGIHLGYRRRKGVELANRVNVKGLHIDIRTDGALEIIPNSETAQGRYEWLGPGLHAIADLPVARIGWTRERVRRRLQHPAPDLEGLAPSCSRIHHPEAYCLKIKSIQGQNGSKGLVRVVCILRDAGRSPQQAFDFLMGVWSPACADPPWSEKEVQHAIDRHYGRPS